MTGENGHRSRGEGTVPELADHYNEFAVSIMKYVLLSGYYGFNNIGDEAVLGGILAGLHAELPEVEPVVLSGDPAFTLKLHGVSAIPRMSLRLIRERLHGASLFISGGGSLLQDVTSLQSPFYYLGMLWLAQREQVPTMMLAQGVGPLKHFLARAWTRRVLNHMKAITVRDAGSAGLLEELGVTVPAEVTADPSFLLEPDLSERLEAWWAANIPDGRPVIGVALRQWNSPDAYDRYHAISDALAEMAKRTGALLLFIPMQAGQDLHVSEEMAGWTPAESRVLNLPLTPCEMLALVGKVDFILAMRLHTLIFATHRAVPAFGLAYDPKVLDFCVSANLPTPMPWEEITAQGLIDMLQTEWAARGVLRGVLQESAARLTAKAQRNIARVREVLDQ